jgi:hypothetical protein
MSLINDAIKRAGEKPASVPSAAELAAGLHAAEARQGGFPVLALLFVLFPVIGLGVWFLIKGLQLHEQPKPAPAQTIVAREPEPAPKPVPAAAPANTVTVVPPAPQAPPAPAYKLQGIYWRPTRPSAVVNGKTVYVGDRVEQARVTAIEQDTVTLSVNGRSKVLQIP